MGNTTDKVNIQLLLSLVVTSLENTLTTIPRTSIKMDEDDEEQLYIGTAESEHIEMYLKAIWHLRERGNDVKISSVAKLLNVKQPSVVQMLAKLNNANLVDYEKGNLVKLKAQGERIGRQMIRNSRLLEVMMKDALKIEIDEEMACGIEHHMKNIFTDALCTLLKHPRKCPHGLVIPVGKCCRKL